MTTLKTRLHRAAVLAFVALALGTSAHAQEEARARRSDAPLRPSTFQVSGTYGGTLGMQVLISSAEYRLSETTQVYQLGVGIVPIGNLPIGALVFGTGPGAGNTGTITTLIARAPGEATDANAVSPNVRELSASSPK